MTEPEVPRGRHASPVLGASRARQNDKPQGPRFARPERRMDPELAVAVAKQFADGDFCIYCLGIHAGVSLPGCPRIATFELDADGKLRAATYHADGDWDTSGVYFASDVEGGDGD